MSKLLLQRQLKQKENKLSFVYSCLEFKSYQGIVLKKMKIKKNDFNNITLIILKILVFYLD